MREGKVSQAVLDRSILRGIKNDNDRIKVEGTLGRDASILESEGGELLVLATRGFCVESPCRVEDELAHLLNHCACGGAKPRWLLVSIVFPQSWEESELKALSAEIDGACARLGTCRVGGHTTVSRGVSAPVVTFTVLGEGAKTLPSLEPGEDVVVAGWTGVTGASVLATLRQEELEGKLPLHMIQEAQRGVDHALGARHVLLAYESGATLVKDGGEGGVFGALWEFAKGFGVGFEVDVKKLPIRQETVEVCEVLQVNPYELLSWGCLVMGAPNGVALCRRLQEQGVPCRIVGRTTAGNDRVLLNEDETRYVTPAVWDYVWRRDEETE